jgi:hypothetical protein
MSRTTTTTVIGPNDCEWLVTPFSKESTFDEKTSSSGVRYPIAGKKLNNIEPTTKNIATEMKISRTLFKVTFLSLLTSIVADINASITDDQSTSFRYEIIGLKPNMDENTINRTYGRSMNIGFIKLF